MRDKISKRTVDQLRPGQSLADTEVRGFRARCLPSGMVTYEFRYRDDKGYRKFISIGGHGSITADQARNLAKKRSGEVADNRDPAGERKTQEAITANTVNAVLDNYIRRVVRAPGGELRSADAIESAFDRLVRPSLGDKSIYELRRSDISGMLDKVQDENGPVMANRTLAYLRTAFNWQVTRDDDFVSPIAKKMARGDESKRERVLTDDEIRDLFTALNELKAGEDVPSCYSRYVRAVLLSGQRRSAVSMASRDEIHGKNWIIPASRMKRSRDHRNKDHVVPISAALAVLFGNGKGYLFSSDGGKTPFSGYSKAKATLDRKIAAIRKRAGRKPMPAWTLHDLRRTARSIMSRPPTTPDIAERVIGHVLGGVRGVYDRYEYADEKRAALEALGRHIDGAVQGVNQAA